MTFTEALEALKQGKKVGRKAYEAGIYIKVFFKQIRFWKNGKVYILPSFFVEDFEADDWEVVE